MGILLGSNFDVQTALPLDSRQSVADTTARDALNSLVRFKGMIVFSIADKKFYTLKNGITNGDWEELSSGGSGSMQIDWTLSSASAPEEKTNNYGLRYYQYDVPIDGTFWQSAFGTFKTPSSYTGGKQVTLKIKGFIDGVIGTDFAVGDKIKITASLVILNPADYTANLGNASASVTITAVSPSSNIYALSFNLGDASGVFGSHSLIGNEMCSISIIREEAASPECQSKFNFIPYLSEVIL